MCSSLPRLNRGIKTQGDRVFYFSSPADVNTLRTNGFSFLFNSGCKSAHAACRSMVYVLRGSPFDGTQGERVFYLSSPADVNPLILSRVEG